MAEVLLSALLSVVFEKLAFVAVNKIAGSTEINSELKKWERSLSQIRDVLNDASEKEVTDISVKQWLHDLQHLAYDIDDILDSLATDAMDREFVNESRPITSMVRNLIPTCCTSFSLSIRMSSKLNTITTELQELVDKKSNLGLSVKDGRSKDKNRSYQTSLEVEPRIVGREDDKEKLLHKLLGDETSNQNFSIVPIVGMGGMGKTTLARCLYNDELVKKRFELKAWVCVSDDFDSFHISKQLYECYQGETKEFKNLNQLQEALADLIMGKRFLLVLDDVWSDRLGDWKTLVGPFFKGACGSKIIITTRKKELLRKLGHDHPYDLQKLSSNDALSLFAQHALGVNNFDSYSKLKAHAEGIVHKCDGLPLALEALGGLLKKNTDEEKWKQLLNNEIWRLKDDGGILPALRLSYQDLSSCLKQLFAYCCLFPKDHVFEKEDLILLWMAEGFLPQSNTNSSMECLGEECFQELWSRSFFQQVADDNKSLFVMHDLMNDLATYVAGEFFVRLDIETEKDIKKKKFRHMSFVHERFITYRKFKAFETHNSLRSFLGVPLVVSDSWTRFYLSRKILVDLLPELPLLRVLCLSRLEIDEVPECVGNMKHLRYLNLSQTRITHLPENVCNLCNLETLIVFGCDSLRKLPDNFLKLKNLRHFDIRDTSLWKITPLLLHELKCLQILSNVVVGENDDFPISGLKNIKNVQGKIDIRGLEKVKSARDVQEANLSQNRVSELKVSWTDMFDDSRNATLEKEVLDALKPHSENLKDLEIESYGGQVFPNWIGDPSFLGLGSVSISKCRKCMFLPPLGQLPSLKKLCISGMNEVKEVGSELLGIGPAFPSLEILEFRDMEGWEVWSTSVGIVDAVFPCLQELTLRNCPKLAKVSLEALPSLRSLDIRNCSDGVGIVGAVFPCLEVLILSKLAKVSLEALPSLRSLDIKKCGDGVLSSLIRVASSVTKLSISGVSDKVWRGVMDYLGAVEEITIWGCNEIRYLWESEVEASRVFVNLRKLKVIKCNEIRYLWESGVEASRVLVNLRELKVWDCSELVSLGEKEEDGCNHLTSLTTLELSMCKNLQHFSCPNNIESLDIHGCTSITTSVSFPPTGGFQKLKSLKIEECNEVLEKELENMLINTNMPMLEVVSIRNLLDLKSVGKLTCFIHLTELSIFSCSSIKSFSATDLPNLASLKLLNIVHCKNMNVGSFGLWPPKLDCLSIGGLKKPISQLGPQQFPTSLVALTLHGGSGEEEDDVISGVQLSHMLPSSLTYLELFRFKKLESVSKGLDHLTSLQHLEIWDCPKMKDLPEKLLPSLLSLKIIDCPNKLKEKTSRRGSYWPLISYIPEVRIYERKDK